MGGHRGVEFSQEESSFAGFFGHRSVEFRPHHAILFLDSLSAALLDLKFESKSLKDPSFLLTGLL